MPRVVLTATGTSLLALASPAFAHVPRAASSSSAGIDTSALLLTVTPMVLAAGLYAVGSMRIEGRRSQTSGRVSLQTFSFFTGLAVLALSLLSPLDRWAAELFSAHMVQHELLMLVAAPLLVLGRPLPRFLWGMPSRTRHAVAGFFQTNGARRTWAVLHGAGCAWLLHALALWVWHVPRFFNAAVADPLTHDLQHLTFLATALLFWSSLLLARRSGAQGLAIVYLFTTTIHTGILGALIALASRPWYADFLQPSTGWSLSALEDQQLGGLIMWVPGSIVYVGAALYLFARWVTAGERSLSPSFSRQAPQRPK